MNSVFNLSSANLRQMTDEELLTWLHSEGLVNMPPIIRSLTCRLENMQEDLAAAQEEAEESEKALKKFDEAVTDGLGQLDDKLGHFASDLEKVSSAILESQGTILDVPGDLLIPDSELAEESPNDAIVIPRKELDAIRAQVDSLSYAISNFETGDLFPASPL